MSEVLRFFDHPAGSYFLFGPRGTGKSTWLRAAYPDAAWIDLLDAEAERNYSARPERLREFVRANAGRGTIVIDEVQRVPQLLPVVHQQMELDRSLRFVMTGSSARKLRREGVDLLAGRAVRCTMHPFMAAELGARCAVRPGPEPGARHGAAGGHGGRAGAHPARVHRPVPATGGEGGRSGPAARRLQPLPGDRVVLARAGAQRRGGDARVRGQPQHGGVLSRHPGGPAHRRPAAGVPTPRQALAGRACQVLLLRLRHFRSLRPAGPLDTRTEMAGPALEGLVLQHLQAWVGYGNADCRIYFWRTRGGSEVDFVLYGEAGFHAIEVKNSRSLRPHDLRGIRTFHADYPEAAPLLLYRGDEALERDGIRCLPVDRFLTELTPGRELPR